MTATTLKTPTPVVPAPETFKDAQFSIRSTCGGFIVTWCPLRHCAAIYAIGAARWSIHSPMEFHELAAMCHLAGITISDTPDSMAWVAACLGAGGHTGKVN